MRRLWISGLLLVALAVAISSTELEVRGVDEKRMVCYYGAWSVYRPGRGKFLVEDIDPKLCTHLVYGFAKLEDNAIQSYDPWEDLKDNYGKGGYLRFSGLKQRNPNLKTLIAIGGWNEGSEKYSDMASSPSTRKTFVDSIIPFLEKYKFDGLDLDWEYPTTRGGKPEDKENFSLLVKELRQALGSQFLLTAAVSPNIETVEQGYEVPVLADNLDFVSVMTYDYNGAWNNFTGHNTPLYSGPKDANYNPHFNANDTLHYWIDAGLPAEKINMGMALYGRGFTLDDANQHGLYAPAKDGIKMGPYTRQDGTWGYNEICEVFKSEAQDWKIVIDPYIQAPYAYKDDVWIGYDDVESLFLKARYARDLGLGGAMVWSIETDDFRGYCHNKKYLLINSIRKTMNGGPKPVAPERPPVVEAEDDNEIIPSTSKKPINNKRTTTTEAEYIDEEITTPKPRPSRKPRPPKRTTTPDNIDYEDITTSKPRPSRGTRPPKRTTVAEEEIDYEDHETTTRRGPRPPRRTTPVPSPIENNNGECEFEGVQPNGNDCNSFLVCQGLGNGQYKKHVQKCAHGLVFDPIIKGCNFPNQVPGCNSKERFTFYKKQSP